MKRAGWTTALLAFSAATAAISEEGWTVGGGVVTRLGMDVSVRGSSYARDLPVHAAQPRTRFPAIHPPAPSVRPPPVNADLGRYADRTFDDGFVFMDPGTDDPESAGLGLTGYWGYDTPDQFDSSLNLINFHRTATRTRTDEYVTQSLASRVAVEPLLDEAVNEDHEASAAGLGLFLQSPVLAGRPEIRFCAGLQALRSDEDVRAIPCAEQVREDRLRVTDRYRISDTHVYTDTYSYDVTRATLPPAPFSGTFAGGGPIIPNTPISFDRDIASTRAIQHERAIRLAGSTTWQAFNEVAVDVDTELYSLWLGPQFGIAVRPRVTLFLQPSVSLNYVTVDAERREVVAADLPDGRRALLRAWSDHGDKSEWIPGAGLAAGGQVGFAGPWFAGVHGGYDWLADEVDVDVGPNPVSVDPSGWTLAALVGRSF